MAERSTAHARPGTNRLDEVDLFRFLVVSFALLNHCFLWLGSEAANATDYATFRRIFSYPSVVALLFMFGNMVQLVYVRRYAQDYGVFLRSVLLRAAYCLFAVWTLAWLDFMLEEGSLLTTVRRMALLLPAPLVSIFAIYFFLLLALPVIAPLRRRGGPWGLVGIIVLLQLYTIYLAPHLPRTPWPFTFVGDFFLGLGTWGPSVLQALAPVCAGMLFAGGFLVREPSKMDRLALLVVVAGGVIVLGRVAWLEGLPTLAYNLTDYSKYRPDNAPEFFAWGVIFSILVYYLSKFLIAKPRLVFLRRLNFVGGATFPYFFLGNIVIFLLHANGVRNLNEPLLTLTSLGVLASGVLLTSGWLRYGHGAALWRWFERRMTALVARIAEKLSPRLVGE